MPWAGRDRRSRATRPHERRSPRARDGRYPAPGSPQPRQSRCAPRRRESGSTPRLQRVVCAVDRHRDLPATRRAPSARGVTVHRHDRVRLQIDEVHHHPSPQNGNMRTPSTSSWGPLLGRAWQPWSCATLRHATSRVVRAQPRETSPRRAFMPVTAAEPARAFLGDVAAATSRRRPLRGRACLREGGDSGRARTAATHAVLDVEKSHRLGDLIFGDRHERADVAPRQLDVIVAGLEVPGQAVGQRR